MIETKNLENINIQKKIINILNSKELDDKLHKNKIITYILIGVFVIIGIIFILVGAFFQNNNERYKLIILDSLGATLILVGICCSFITPIKNFNLIKKRWIHTILENEEKYNDLINIYLNQINNLKVWNIKIISKFITFSFEFNEKEYQILYTNNELILNKTETNLEIAKLNKNNFNYLINIKKSLANNFSQINIENFALLIEMNFKIKLVNLINELNQKIGNFNND